MIKPIVSRYPLYRGAKHSPRSFTAFTRLADAVFRRLRLRRSG